MSIDNEFIEEGAAASMAMMAPILGPQIIATTADAIHNFLRAADIAKNRLGMPELGNELIERAKRLLAPPKP